MRRWLAALALLLTGCASVTPPHDVVGEAINPDNGERRVATIQIDGNPLPATWYLSTTPDAAALVMLQPGFARRCSHLRQTTSRLMGAGLMALCVDAPMAGGNPALAHALAAWLMSGVNAPDGRPLPARIIVGGHSAGARFAAGLGARLQALAPQRLAGALLFDPVATAGFEADLRTLADGGRRPVLAVLAPAHGCNAGLNALPALRQLRQDGINAGGNGFVGVQLTVGGTHVDVEGDDSDWIGRAACGTPLPANVALLRELALRWALDIAHGRQPMPPPAGAWRAIDLEH